MQFLALIRRKTETFSDAQFAPHLEAEAEAARRLHAEFAVRQIWGRTDVPGAVMMIEAASAEDALAILQTLPLVRLEMLEVQIVGLAAYRGFAPRTP